MQRLSSTQIQLAKNGNTIACGGTLTPGDTGLTLVKASSGVGSQYIIEAVASAGTGAWGIISGTCQMQRLVFSRSSTYTVPPSGTVTLRIAHATSSSSAVSTSADCTYTVASCPDCTAGKYLSDASPCTCPSCPDDSTSLQGSTAASACLCNAGQWCSACDIRTVHVIVRLEEAVLNSSDGRSAGQGTPAQAAVLALRAGIWLIPLARRRPARRSCLPHLSLNLSNASAQAACSPAPASAPTSPPPFRGSDRATQPADTHTYDAARVNTKQPAPEGAAPARPTPTLLPRATRSPTAFATQVRVQGLGLKA